MKPKQPSKRYQTDLRIKATPHQVASSFFRSPPVKQDENKQPIRQKREAK